MILFHRTYITLISVTCIIQCIEYILIDHSTQLLAFILYSVPHTHFFKNAGDSAGFSLVFVTTVKLSLVESAKVG